MTNKPTSGVRCWRCNGTVLESASDGVASHYVCQSCGSLNIIGGGGGGGNEPTTGEITTRLYGWIAKAGNQERCRDELLAINALTRQEREIAELTESQEREIERLRKENLAMFRLQMDNQGVWIPDGSEYQPITFFGHPVPDALRKIEEHAALTARAEQAEARDFCAGCDFIGTVGCHCNRATWRGLPQEGEGK